MIDPNSDAGEQLKNYVFTSVISADNDEFDLSEKDKQKIIERYAKFKGEPAPDWGYILEPIKDEGVRNSLVDILGD